MSRRVWIGILAGVLAAVVVLGVAGGAYRAGQHDEVVTRTVTDGQAVRVLEGHGWGFWPGPGIFLFPLLVVGTVFLVSRAAPWRHGTWHGPYGPGGSWDDWHRQAHEQQAASAPGGSGPSAPGPA